MRASAMRCTLQSLRSSSTALSLAGVFVINLDRRPDRWAAIRHVCLRAGLPSRLIERVPAVEGAAVDAAACLQCGFISRLGLMRLSEPSEHRIWGMDLNPGALGCALSHVQLWSRIAALDTPSAAVFCPSFISSAVEKKCYLVLEDDAELVDRQREESMSTPSSSPSLLDALHHRMDQRVPSDWELLYIGGLDTAGQCSRLQVAEGVARVPQYHRTTSAYLLTPQGARRLLATCLPLTFQLDTVMTIKAGLPRGRPSSPSAMPYVLDPVSYTLQPPLMRQSALLGTDIQM